MLIVFLVKGQDGRCKSGNLLLQFFAGHQVAHGAQGLSHSQPQLEEHTKREINMLSGQTTKHVDRLNHRTAVASLIMFK